MIEVRIRHEYESKAKRLMEWPAGDLDSVIPLIRGWGLYHHHMETDGFDLSGQFHVSDTGAYFEILVSDEEA